MGLLAKPLEFLGITTQYLDDDDHIAQVKNYTINDFKPRMWVVKLPSMYFNSNKYIHPHPPTPTIMFIECEMHMSYLSLHQLFLQLKLLNKSLACV